MSTGIARRDRRLGMALVTVMLVTVTIAALIATAVAVGVQGSYSAKRLANRIRAGAIAEAGAHYAYSVLATNFDLRSNPGAVAPADYGGGRYGVGIATSPVDSRIAVIISTGTYQNVSVVTILDVKDYGRDTVVTNPGLPGWTNSVPPPPGSVWDYGLFANGYVDFNGKSRFMGYMHVNQYVTQSGTSTWGYGTNGCFVAVCNTNRGFDASGQMTIYGTLWSAKVSPNVTCSNIVRTPVPVLPMPNLSAKFTDWYNTAVANGQVMNGSQTIKKTTTWDVPGGVRWINGNLILQGSPTLSYTGCLFITGSLEVNGSSALIQTAGAAGFPAIVTRDGGMTINGSHQWTGLVYSGGDITWNGSGTTRGTVIANGNIRFNGSADVNVLYQYCMPPGLTPSEQGGIAPSVRTNYVSAVGVSAWQK